MQDKYTRHIRDKLIGLPNIVSFFFFSFLFRYHIRWSHPYTNLDSTVHAPYFRFSNATGGMMVQTSTLDKDLNDSKYVNIKCNFPFDMYVFRSTVDHDSTNLSWLSDFASTQTYMQFKGSTQPPLNREKDDNSLAYLSCNSF